MKTSNHKKLHTFKPPVLSLYLLPSLLGLLVFYIVPVAESLVYTFTQGIAEKKFVGLQNFADLFSSSAFRLSVWNTFRFMGIGVPALLFLALAVSFLFQKYASNGLRFLLLLPMVIPSSAYLPGVQEIFKENGLLGRLAQMAGGTGADYLTEYPFLILLFIYLLKNIGYLTIVMGSAMEEIPKEFQDIFRLEKEIGSGYLFRIVIPMMAPTLFFSLILAVMGCLKIFREVWILYGQNPPMQVYLLQYFMNNNFYKLNFQRLSSAAFLVILLLTAFIVLLLRMQNRVRVED